MLIATVGCVHGEMKRVYKSILEISAKMNKKIDLVLFTGDLQTARTTKDLNSMSVPDKYKKLGDFHHYFKGKDKIPILTVAISGNHECSDYLLQYKDGGYLIPNFYYMGTCGIISVKGIVVAGWSGTYQEHNFNKPRNEVIPCKGSDIKSAYHVRIQDYEKLSSYKGHVDIGMNHDWPGSVAYYGNTQKILEQRPWFKSDIKNNCLGNPYAFDLIQQWKPKYWISSHMHYKFTCQIGNPLIDSKTAYKDPNTIKSYKFTTFIALDKPKGRRLDYLEIIEVENKEYDELITRLL